MSEGVLHLSIDLTFTPRRRSTTGRVPASEYARMRAPFMAGDFPFPVKYGYATVGRIEGGTESLRGRTIFTLHPHQNFFNIPANAAVVLPENLPPQRAVLAANMETALNLIWDAAPLAGERMLVIGAGVIGAATAFAARHAGRWRGIVLLLLVLPFWISYLMRMLAWKIGRAHV